MKVTHRILLLQTYYLIPFMQLEVEEQEQDSSVVVMSRKLAMASYTKYDT